jgi:hypothetical protein
MAGAYDLLGNMLQGANASDSSATLGIQAINSSSDSFDKAGSLALKMDQLLADEYAARQAAISDSQKNLTTSMDNIYKSLLSGEELRMKGEMNKFTQNETIAKFKKSVIDSNFDDKFRAADLTSRNIDRQSVIANRIFNAEARTSEFGERVRHNIVGEGQNDRRIDELVRNNKFNNEESKRSHLANEEYNINNLIERNRSNVAKENETSLHHRNTEEISSMLGESLKKYREDNTKLGRDTLEVTKENNKNRNLIDLVKAVNSGKTLTLKQQMEAAKLEHNEKIMEQIKDPTTGPIDADTLNKIDTKSLTPDQKDILVDKLDNVPLNTLSNLNSSVRKLISQKNQTALKQNEIRNKIINTDNTIKEVEKAYGKDYIKKMNQSLSTIYGKNITADASIYKTMAKYGVNPDIVTNSFNGINPENSGLFFTDNLADKEISMTGNVTHRLTNEAKNNIKNIIENSLGYKINTDSNDINSILDNIRPGDGSKLLKKAVKHQNLAINNQSYGLFLISLSAKVSDAEKNKANSLNSGMDKYSYEDYETKKLTPREKLNKSYNSVWGNTPVSKEHF